MRKLISAKTRVAVAVALSMAWSVSAGAQNLPPWHQAPFTATISNNTPLAFGMNPDDAAKALGTPLKFVSGRSGDEILLAIRTAGGSGFFDRHDRLYLQFRHSRLTGWKGDWGSHWMLQ